MNTHPPTLIWSPMYTWPPHNTHTNTPHIYTPHPHTYTTKTYTHLHSMLQLVVGVRVTSLHNVVDGLCWDDLPYRDVTCTLCRWYTPIHSEYPSLVHPTNKLWETQIPHYCKLPSPSHTPLNSACSHVCRAVWQVLIACDNIVTVILGLR